MTERMQPSPGGKWLSSDPGEGSVWTVSRDAPIDRTA